VSVLSFASRSARVLLPARAATVFALLAGAGCAAAPGTEPADLVLRNGTIVTMDDARPTASAVAVRGDHIVAVGSEGEIRRYIGDATQVIDLAGRTVVPGFIEGHGHFMSLGRAQMILDLTQAANWSELIAMVGAAAAQAAPGEWIAGRGWHQEKWDPRPLNTIEGVPTHQELSRVTPDNPVLLTHASGHAAFANVRALELAGVGRDTPDPPGGEIVRDPAGNPTGLLRETAQRLVAAAQQRAQEGRARQDIEAEARRQVALAGAEALAKGVTSFHDAGSSFQTIDFLRQLADEGALPIRLYVMVRGESNDELARRLPDYRLIGHGNDFLTVRAIKRQIDGALGAHGAWLLEPYEDLATSVGLVLEPPEDIRRTAEIAIAHGFQLNTHAIGDRANRVVLDIYEEVFRAHPDRTDLRWRIEHAQHLNPADIARFRQLGLIASMQGVHATSDGPWVPARIGEERARSGAFVWRDLLDAGVVIVNGTDVPVEDIDPIASFHASVTRVMPTGQPFYPAQRMTREEALRSYTLAAAYAAFEEDRKGSITPGKLADLVVLTRNIMTVPDAEILDAHVHYTIVGGRIRYAAPGAGEIATH
jgi:predicted amidohydrolase YtcJ